jgi:ornithine cyclodeaminase/alanine dehydrogenase-like protein (mu-crystallin family)
MLILDKSQTLDGLARLDVVATVREVLLAQANGQVSLPLESYLAWTNVLGDSARSIAMHASIGGARRIAGVKIINANPQNPALGLPRASGLTMVFDERTAVVRAIMPAEDISAARTAAVSTLAVEMCQRDDAASLGIIGCGPVGAWHLDLLSSRFAYDSVRLFDTVPSRATELAERYASRGLTIDVAPTARDTVQASDVVVTATTVRSPYVEWGWLKPGSTVVNVSLDDLTEDVFVAADKLYVDDWSLVRADEHRILGRLARAGIIAGPGDSLARSQRRVTGVIADLVAGRLSGRSAMDEVVVVNPFGMASSDIAIAHAIVESVGHTSADPRE